VAFSAGGDGVGELLEQSLRKATIAVLRETRNQKRFKMWGIAPKTFGNITFRGQWMPFIETETTIE
jgi:hypothetical protein